MFFSFLACANELYILQSLIFFSEKIVSYLLNVMVFIKQVSGGGMISSIISGISEDRISLPILGFCT